MGCRSSPELLKEWSGGRYAHKSKDIRFIHNVDLASVAFLDPEPHPASHGFPNANALFPFSNDPMLTWSSSNLAVKERILVPVYFRMDGLCILKFLPWRQRQFGIWSCQPRTWILFCERRSHYIQIFSTHCLEPGSLGLPLELCLKTA